MVSRRTKDGGMNRRDFVKRTVGSAVTGSLIACGNRSDKPNVLFLWTDQQRRDTMKVYGNTRIQTPNLDQLAADSCVFENAYVSQPVCTPSRSTVMTGLWPHQSGCTQNNIPLPFEIPCLPEIIKDSDYRTGYIGKWHLGDEVFPQHGFEEWETMEDGYARHFRPERDKSTMSSYNRFLRQQGIEPDEPDGSFSRDKAASLPLELSKTRFLENKAKDFMKRHQREPFLLYVNFLEPHPPYFGALSNLYDPSEVYLPESLDHRPGATEPLRYQLILERIKANPRTGYPLDTEEAWRRFTASYWGLVSQVDRSVGAILGALDDLGLAENTIVVYTTDHGEMLGAHGLVGKGVAYEESMNVPWLLRAPGYRGGLLKGRYSHIDLVPTLLELLKVARPGGLPGESLLPVMRGDSKTVKDVFVEWNPQLINNRSDYSAPRFQTEEIQRAINTYARTVLTQDGWKLTLRDGDKSELYNLNDDPFEEVNLYGRADQREITQRLARKIQDWQRSVKDIAPAMS